MKRIKSLFMTVAVMCCALYAMTSCQDNIAGNRDNPLSPSEAYVQDVKTRIEGTWSADIDGLDDVDLYDMTFRFDKEGKLDVILNYFDFDKQDYLSETMAFNYDVLERTTDADGRQMEHLGVRLTQEYIDRLRQLAKEAEQEISEADLVLTDTIDFAIDSDTLYMVNDIDLSDEETRELVEEGLLSDYQAFSKGEQRRDKSTVLALLDEAKEKVLPDGNQTKTRANYPALDLAQWMKDIPDDRLVCKMAIPGAHDAGTGHMKDEWMLTLGQTQLKKLGEQWDAGCRVFDLRTRWTKGPDTTFPGLHEEGNWVYHGFLECHLMLKEALDEIIAKLEQHKTTDGVIIMIQNEDKGFDLPRAMSFLANRVAPLDFNFVSLDAKKSVNESLRLVKEKLFDKGLLAKFSETMTMKDLRGKALVVINDSVDGADYRGMEDYICLWHKKKMHTPSMSSQVKAYKEQNIYEPDENGDSDEAYAARKESEFRKMCIFNKEHPDSIYWMYNAANGYFREYKKIPDYATMAHTVYASLIADIEAYPWQRGIILQDYLGESEVFKRVHTGGLIPGGIVNFGTKVINPITSLIFGSNTIDYAAFWACYKAAKLVSKYKNTRGKQLAEAVINRNFHNEDALGDPAKLTATNGSLSWYKMSYTCLFDGRKDTKWSVTEQEKENCKYLILPGTVWFVEFQSEAAATAKSYTLTTAYDIANNPRRNGQKWRLLARLSKEQAWTRISYIDNTDRAYLQLPTTNSTDKEYMIDTPGFYKYYRLEVWNTWETNWLPAMFSKITFDLGGFRFNY